MNDQGDEQSAAEGEEKRRFGTFTPSFVGPAAALVGATPSLSLKGTRRTRKQVDADLQQVRAEQKALTRALRTRTSELLRTYGRQR